MLTYPTIARYHDLGCGLKYQTTLDDAFIALLAMTQWTMDADMQQQQPPPPSSTPHALLRATRPISFLNIDLIYTVPPKLQQRFGSDLHSRQSFVSFLPFVIININIHPNQHCPGILIIHASQSHPTARSGANPFDNERRSTRLLALQITRGRNAKVRAYTLKRHAITALAGLAVQHTGIKQPENSYEQSSTM